MYGKGIERFPFFYGCWILDSGHLLDFINWILDEPSPP